MLKYHCHFLCSINPISIYTLMIPSCMDRLHRCAYQRKYKHHGLKKLQEIYSLLTIYSKVKIHLYLNNMIYWHQKNNQIKIKIKINNSHQWIQFNFKNFDNLLQHAFFFFFTIFYLFFFIFLYQQEFNLIEIYRIYIYIYHQKYHYSFFKKLRSVLPPRFICSIKSTIQFAIPIFLYSSETDIYFVEYLEKNIYSA